MKILSFFLLLSISSVFSCDSPHIEKPAKIPCYIEVGLKESIPPGFDTTFDEQCDLQLKLPSGKKLDYEILNGNSNRHNNKIASVHIRLAKTSSDLRETIAYLNTEVLKLAPGNKEVSANEFIKDHQLNPDPNYPTGGDTYAYNIEIEKGIQLQAGVNTVSFIGDNKIDRKWVVVLIFYTSEYLDDLRRPECRL